MQSVKLLNYMENIRYDRKMTLDNYLDGVISQRQYYRYRSGESEAPFEVIIKLSNKLQIPLLKLISSYRADAEKEVVFIKEYFNLVLSKHILEAKELIKTRPNLMLLDEDSRVFYQIGTILLQYYSNSITETEMISSLKASSDFANILKKEILHDSEVYFLGVIMEFSSKDREIIFEKLRTLRENKKLLLGGNVLFNAQVFFWIIKNLGRMGQFEELIDIANEAIEFNQNNYSYYSMEYFYYYKALSYLALKDQKGYEEALRNTILYVLHFDKVKRDHFFKMIQKDTNSEAKSFILDKILKEM